MNNPDTLQNSMTELIAWWMDSNMEFKNYFVSWLGDLEQVTETSL